MTTAIELRAKIEALDDVAKLLDDCYDPWDGAYVNLPEEIEGMRSRLNGELRRIERSARQLHADAETVVGRS